MTHRMPAPRSGFTLVEVMVTIAIILLILGIGIPSMAGLLGLQQRGVVHQLATTFAYLRDEATLRNVTFRIVFDLDKRSWTVQAGSPDATIFENQEDREEWEEELESRLSRFTEREIEEGAAKELEDQTGRFQNLEDITLDAQVELPGGSAFAWVWTPQFEEPQEPHAEAPEDPEENTIVYAHIFPDGQMEPVVIRIVDEDDPDDGWTLIVEPLTGRIHLENTLVEPEDLFEWLPDEGPEMPLG
ncbi:MAG: prepilin-type N-terminal cleavage/methylation domain-containing protein [Pseudomonadota bacterium]